MDLSLEPAQVAQSVTVEANAPELTTNQPDRGNVNRQGPLMHFLARDLAEPPQQAPLPEGFRCRTVELDDLAERVAIHREVWAPSRVTESSFATVQASWPYRASLDCVVETPDGLLRRVARAVAVAETAHGGDAATWANQCNGCANCGED